MYRIKYLNSEYSQIKQVLLYKPGVEVSEVKEVSSVLYNAHIDYCIIDKEYDEIINLYRKLNIHVHLIDSSDILNRKENCLYNMMYARDLVFMTSAGAILSKMKHEVRKDEVIYAEKALNKIGIPILHRIDGDGTLEGADALWLNERTVLVGVGNRTNISGYNQVKKILCNYDIECITVPVPEGIQHLLGVLQFVDCDLALVRNKLVDHEITNILKKHKIKIINIPENVEVRQRQAMNIVTVSPRNIIIPENCPETRALYEQNGIKIAGVVKISQLINGAGGLACATSILSRKLYSGEISDVCVGGIYK